MVFLSVFKVRMNIQESLIRERERDKDIITVRSAEINQYKCFQMNCTILTNDAKPQQLLQPHVNIKTQNKNVSHGRDSTAFMNTTTYIQLSIFTFSFYTCFYDLIQVSHPCFLSAINLLYSLLRDFMGCYRFCLENICFNPYGALHQCYKLAFCLTPMLQLSYFANSTSCRDKELPEKTLGDLSRGAEVFLCSAYNALEKTAFLKFLGCCSCSLGSSRGKYSS